MHPNFTLYLSCVHLTWNKGDIFHMSTGPAPRVCPRAAWNAKRGMPRMRDRMRNWRIKLDPNWTLSVANLLMLKRPKVHPRPAKTELSPWGQGPRGLRPSQSSLLSSARRLLLLERERSWVRRQNRTSFSMSAHGGRKPSVPFIVISFQVVHITFVTNFDHLSLAPSRNHY